jgi:ABC-type lipoprotein export system ATPase subunit
MTENNDGNLVEVRGVSKRYTEAGELVLNDVSFTVNRGATIAITGPSGSGKSTLLNIIGGLDQPSGGEVRVNGQEIASLSENALAKLRNQEMGFIFQLHHLLPQCTALENVLLPTLAGQNQSDRNTVQKRAMELLGRVGLTDHRDKRPGELSGGQRQRTALVRALINEPKLLLADEPTGSLDRTAADEMGDLLVKLNREQGVTLIVVSHSALLAARMNLQYELADGKLTLQDSSK